jgi:hypothetical protein
MGFIKYQKESKGAKSITAKTIGISDKGRFAFYKPIFEKFLKDKPFVELYYDLENNKIGIKPVSELTPSAFRLQGNTTKMIVAKKFLKQFNISVTKNRYEFNDENEMLVIPLESIS